MKAVGLRRVGADTDTLDADTLVLDRMETYGGFAPSVSAYLDSLGGTSGVALVRAVVYDATGKLLGYGSEVPVPSGIGAAWMQFPLWDETPGGVPLPLSDDAYLGLHVGGVGGVLRVYGDEDGSGFRASDSYSDGAPATLPATSGDQRPALTIPYVSPWVPPAAVELAWYARLPFPEAQVFLGSTGPTERYRRVSCGWHGASFNAEQGSFALARTGSDLAALVGDKIAVTYRGKTVYAYVMGEGDLIEDLSLTRRLFQALAPLATYELSVGVEVLA